MMWYSSHMNATPICEYFALCMNPSDGVVIHPILGDVPTCTRCATRMGVTLFPYVTVETAVAIMKERS